jgi:hypothetical protein
LPGVNRPRANSGREIFFEHFRHRTCPTVGSRKITDPHHRGEAR